MHKLLKNKEASRRSVIQKQYSKILQSKLKHIGRITESEKEAVNQSMNIKQYNVPRYKHSTSFNSESLLTNKDISNEIKFRGSSRRNSNDDEILNLGRLSLINMKARYELLNANRMLVDLDVSLSVRLY